MWLSKKLSIDHVARQESAAADMGMTTIGGASASVMTRGEQRDLEVFAPGGLVWQPSAGDTVLVVKGGPGGRESCVVAAATAGHAPESMSPGEVYLYSNADTFLYLRADGAIAVQGELTVTGPLRVMGDVELTGRVDIQGSLYVNGIPYKPCTCG